MPVQRQKLSQKPSDRSLPEGATLVKACNRCHDRKTKCDGKLPRCTSCVKNAYHECNVSDCISWSNSRVVELESRIQWLEQLINRECQVENFIQKIATGSSVASSVFNKNDNDSGQSPTDEFAEEIGMLSLRACGSYMGSMSGITLAALISSSIGLYGENVPSIPPEISHVRNCSGQPPIIACFPPQNLLSIYITDYLDCIHQWYPIIDLNLLDDSIHRLYQSRENIDTFPRFVILMIAALTPRNLQDMNGPIDYFRFATTFIPTLLARKSLESITVLLFLCIYSIRSWKSGQGEHHDVNAWEIIGLAMRLGVSMGLTRNNEKWPFSLVQREYRRQLWWSLYSLERYIAVTTGRVLSIRNEGIDALSPQALFETLPDRLVAFVSNSITTIDYRPFLHLLEQRRLLGEVLESVYITRPRMGPRMSIEDTSARVDTIQSKIVEWARYSFQLTEPDTVTHDILQVAFHQVTLLLHRPSPSFPCPPAQVLNVCMGAARATIRISARAVENQLVEQIIPGWQGFAAVFTCGITLLYCSWSGPGCSNAIQIGEEYSLDEDLALCRNTLNHLAADDDARRYAQLFERLIGAFGRMSRIPIPILDVMQSTTAVADPFSPWFKQSG
ncbi:uncharacterized protein I206_106266 [Kwoniella pini CBS 10737]|uniref:Zn(2)-C6 fungal-type domain-containing protein n=1 Tax=Kwoniella pini CBS 10737 TaxID=1296096 RepID=A0A1B9I1I5_9TREE|nr:uncharacterized protein I206_05092 [Kwoniella pini CBS 10737]OCF49399.1 hypothetical protein I206_05092 [Kwoniella pini CBS 10737]